MAGTGDQQEGGRDPEATDRELTSILDRLVTMQAELDARTPVYDSEDTEPPPAA